MLDGLARRALDPHLVAAGRWLAAKGIGADQVTIAGFVLGLFSALLIWQGATWIALAVFLASRLLDGLDGAVAAATRRTDRGGFLDIALDFTIYGAVPLAFAALSPAANAWPAALLLFAFYVNGTTFLAFAAIAAKRGLDMKPRGEKSLVFTVGLAEATETIAVMGVMMLVPRWFPELATVFAVLCLATAALRIAHAVHSFR